jgi:hypothetical protein
MKNMPVIMDFYRASINAIAYVTDLFQDEEFTFYVLNTFVPVASDNALKPDICKGRKAAVGGAFEQHAKNKV